MGPENTRERYAGSGRAGLKRTAPRYEICCARRRHQASSSPQGDGRPCLPGCRLQTTYDWPHRCRKRSVPRQPETGHRSCGSPYRRRKISFPWSSCTIGGGFFLGGLTLDCNIQASLLLALKLETGGIIPESATKLHVNYIVPDDNG